MLHNIQYMVYILQPIDISCKLCNVEDIAHNVAQYVICNNSCILCFRVGNISGVDKIQGTCHTLDNTLCVSCMPTLHYAKLCQATL